MGIKASTERLWGDGTQWRVRKPHVQLFCKKYSQMIRSCDFFVKYSDYRLDVCSRFYFQLCNLERTNHTSLKYILVLIGKSFMDELKPHTDAVASFSLCGYTWNPTGTPSPLPSQNGCIRDSKVMPASAERKHNTQQQALLWPTWQETLTGYQGWKHQLLELEMLNFASCNFLCLALLDATSKRATYVIGRKSTGLCCVVELCPPKSYVQVLTPSACHMTLFGNKTFADVIKLRWGHTALGWILHPTTGVLIRKERFGDTQGEHPTVMRQRLEYCVYKPRTPRIIRSQEKLGERQGRIPP